MLFSVQTPAAGGTAFAQFAAAWCYDGNGYILNDTGTSLDVRIGASGSVITLAASALLPIKLVNSMAELYVRRTDQSTTQVTVEAQVGTGSAGGGTTPVQAGVIAATAAAAVAGLNVDGRMSLVDSSAGKSVSGLVVKSPASSGTELLSNTDNETGWTGQLNDAWHYINGVTPTKSTDAHSGTYAQGVTFITAGDFLFQESAATAKKWYLLRAYVKRAAGTAGDVSFGMWNPSENPKHDTGRVTSATYELRECAIRATGAWLYPAFWNNGTVSDTVLVDDQSVQELTAATLYNLKDTGSAYGKAAVEGVSIPVGHNVGVVLCADSATPTSYVTAWYDRTRSCLRFEKVVAGAITPLGTTGSPDGFWYASIEPAVTYRDNCSIAVIRKPGTNIFRLFYDSQLLGEVEVTDTEIVSNTFAGVFSTSAECEYTFRHSTATTKRTVVFLGGSITNGAGADSTRTCWREKLGQYLDTKYIDIDWTFVNAAVGGTTSFYSLMRLDSDVFATSPNIIVIDQSVNDSIMLPTWYGFPYIGEATLRRIRKAFPSVPVYVLDFIRADATDENVLAVKAGWKTLASRYGCFFYAMADALAAIDGGTLPLPEAAVTPYFESPTGVHPNQDGHDVIFAQVKDEVTPYRVNATATPAALGVAAAQYERNPRAILGKNLSATDWAADGNDLVSSTANAVLTFSGTFGAIGLDVALGGGNGTCAWSLDGGEEELLDFSPGGQSYFQLLSVQRGAHLFALRVVSGTIRLKQLLVI